MKKVLLLFKGRSYFLGYASVLFRYEQEGYLSIDFIVTNVYDFRKEEGFPKTYFVYDTQEKVFSRYIIYNGDYTSKNEFYMVMLTPINAQGESWATLNAFDLCRDYQKGKLKGKLKEVAATLEEDDNRVVMLVKSKK